MFEYIAIRFRLFCLRRAWKRAWKRPDWCCEGSIVTGGGARKITKKQLIRVGIEAIEERAGEFGWEESDRMWKNK